MHDFFEQFLDFMYEYWMLVIGVVCLMIGGVYGVSNVNTASKVSEDMQALVQQYNKLEKSVKGESTVDVEETVKRVEADSINVRELGEQLIAAQTVLSKFYFSNQTMTDTVRAEADAAKKVVMDNTTSAAELQDVWKRNVAWTLELKTVVNYNADSMPVIFIMENTSSRDLMGLVRGVYNSKQKKITDIQIEYTKAGMKDMTLFTGDH